MFKDKKFKYPLYRKNDLVKLGDKLLKVVSMYLDSGVTWYELSDGKIYGENELKKV